MATTDNRIIKRDGPTQPCGQNCPDRKAGCAAECEAWKAYVEQRNAYYAARLKKGEQMASTGANKQATARHAYRKKNNPGYF